MCTITMFGSHAVITKEPTAITKKYVDLIYNDDYRIAALTLTNDFFKKVASLNWLTFSTNDREDIIENYIPERINECINLLKQSNIEWNSLEDLAIQASSYNSTIKKIVNALIHYSSFFDTSLDNKKKWALAKLMKTNMIRSCDKPIITLKYDVECPVCRKKHSIKKINNDFTYDIGDSCSGCGHTIQHLGLYYEEDIFSVRNTTKTYKQKILTLCTCKTCSSIKADYLEKLNSLKEQWLDSSVRKVFDYLNQHNIPSNSCFTDKELNNYYKINRNNLSKTSRLILSMKPESYSELETIVSQLTENEFYSKITARDIIDRLKKEKVVLSSIAVAGSDGNIESCRKIVLDFIESFTENYCSLIWDMEYTLDKYNWYDDGTINYGMYFLHDIHTEVFSLNKYFINPEIQEVEAIPLKKYNILKSEAESCEFEYLKKQYPDYTIIPNYPLSQIVDVSILSSYFGKKDLTYLRYCILDFIIIDNDGYVVKVVEVQKGSHHDTEEWIMKDRLKREAIEQLGIFFEETF